MYSFKNIDEYTPLYFERIGTLRGKRWYTNHGNTGLFKPRRFEYGDRRVFCANHYGEFMGYVLASALDIEACPVELAHLTHFYEHFYKYKYNGTPIPRDGAISYKVSKNTETITPGKVLIDKYSSTENKNDLKVNSLTYNDQITVVIDAVTKATLDFYQEKGADEISTKKAVDRNVTNTIKMIIYDCAFANNDRHDENWSMVTTENDIQLYPLYDNERVLGLCENQRNVSQLLSNPALLSRYNTKKLASRMREPISLSTSYKDVLSYLISAYPDITIPMLQKISNNITPSFIEDSLNQMDGLPKEYVEFGSRIYGERYLAINQILNRAKQTNRNPFINNEPDDYRYDAL